MQQPVQPVQRPVQRPVQQPVQPVQQLQHKPRVADARVAPPSTTKIDAPIQQSTQTVKTKNVPSSKTRSSSQLPQASFLELPLTNMFQHLDQDDANI